jgi:alpha-methylacyl-CoA racemase
VKIVSPFSTGEGRQALQQLCAGADVLLDPFRPGVLEALGLDPAQLLEVFSFFLIFFS